MHLHLDAPYSDHKELQRKRLGSFDDEQQGDEKKQRT